MEYKEYVLHLRAIQTSLKCKCLEIMDIIKVVDFQALVQGMMFEN